MPRLSHNYLLTTNIFFSIVSCPSIEENLPRNSCRPKMLIMGSEIQLVFSIKFMNSCRVNVYKFKKKNWGGRTIIQCSQNRIKIPATFKIYIWNVWRRLKFPINLFRYFLSNRPWLGNTTLEVWSFAVRNSLLQFCIRNVWRDNRGWSSCPHVDLTNTWSNRNTEKKSQAE